MKLDEIHTEWAADSRIDKSHLDDESIQIPKLHAKYMKILSGERMAFNVLNASRIKMKTQLEDYFSGVIDGRDIGREPWQLKESKSGVEKRIDNDKEIVDMNIRILNQEEKVLVVKEIINNLNQRSFQISNAIKFIAWSQGELG